MNNKHVRWLSEELPQLVGRGVVSAEVADRLRQHYGAADGGGGGRSWALLVFGVLGSALIGAGVILLLAHNWDELGRGVRAVLSFAPLVLALGLAGFVLAKRATSMVWREATGTAWALAIGATISLVAQTYHISGDFGAFLLTWTLLGLPAVYLLRSSSTAILYLVGATCWAGEIHQTHSLVLGYWLLIGLVVPHLWLVARESRYGGRMGLMLWVLAGCLPFGIGFCLWGVADRGWMLAYAAYFAVLYLVGARWFDDGRAFWQRPLQTVGALGVLGLALALTFRDAWGYWTRHADWLALGHSPMVLWPVAAVGLWAYAWRKHPGLRFGAWGQAPLQGKPAVAADACPEPVERVPIGRASGARRDVVALLFGALPVVTLVGLALGTNLTPLPVVVLFNLYVLGLGVALIGLGVRDRRLGVVNLGLLVTSALIIARFFDSDLSFVWRGLAFIAVGIGFLATNMVLLRRPSARGGARPPGAPWPST